MNPDKPATDTDPDKPTPLYVTVIGWAVALGIVACVALGVIALAKVILA